MRLHWTLQPSSFRLKKNFGENFFAGKASFLLEKSFCWKTFLLKKLWEFRAPGQNHNGITFGVIYGRGLGLHKLFHTHLESPFYTTLGCRFGYRCLLEGPFHTTPGYRFGYRCLIVWVEVLVVKLQVKVVKSGQKILVMHEMTPTLPPAR
uniref:Uncharacterized protein n=1 Tax=Eutreptiella gymnastica TaxID=73025 RepID=A0A7S4G0H0_9EUGL